MSTLPQSGDYFVEKLLELGRHVRDAVLAARGRNAGFAGVSKITSADTIFEIDTHVEPVITQYCERWAAEVPMVLIAEGIADELGREGKAVFPRGTPEAMARIRLIIDPVDGTRGLMYDKRSAWCLAGIAPNNGEATRLRDIEVAVQVELPTSKLGMADLLWAVKGGGAHGIRERLHAPGDQPTQELPLQPSQADNIMHGFAGIVNFFPGTKELAGRLMEEIAVACLGNLEIFKGSIYDDQYISTGGQFYELIVGHDRFNADLRPLLYQIRGMPPGLTPLCCHPYDVSSMLIAQEAGVLITDGMGQPFDGPLDVESPVHWAAYANAALRARIEPVMLAVLRRWLDGRK